MKELYDQPLPEGARQADWDRVHPIFRKIRDRIDIGITFQLVVSPKLKDDNCAVLQTGIPITDYGYVPVTFATEKILWDGEEAARDLSKPEYMIRIALAIPDSWLGRGANRLNSAGDIGDCIFRLLSQSGRDFQEGSLIPPDDEKRFGLTEWTDRDGRQHAVLEVWFDLPNTGDNGIDPITGYLNGVRYYYPEFETVFGQFSNAETDKSNFPGLQKAADDLLRAL